MILFRYLQLLRLILLKILAFTVRIGHGFAPLLSILITSGLPLFPMALLRNFCADPFILLFVSRKSTVLPYLIYRPIQVTVLPSYLDIGLTHSPTIADTALRLWMLTSIIGENLKTQRLRVEWSTSIPLIFNSSLTSL
jgi:hypothetical protein